MTINCLVVMDGLFGNINVENKSLWKFIRGVSENIGIIYFFILPVYFPIRALGVELFAYKKVLHEDSQLILFFLQVTILLSFVSILLSFFMNFINKKVLINNEYMVINWYRFIAAVFSVVFVVSSYFVLNPTNIFRLYLWSGVHYFIISFFQILIRAELNTYKNRDDTSISEANNYFGFSLNMVGIVSICIFGWFYENNDLSVYSKYCVYLEVLFVLYLVVVRGYFNDVKKILSLFGARNTLIYLLFMAIVLVIASILSYFVMSIGIIAPIITLGLISIIYCIFKKTVKKSDLILVLNISLSYGLILSVFTASIFTYFLHNSQSSIDLFNFSYSSEPFVSLILGAIMAWSLVNNYMDYSREKLNKQVSFVNYVVPLIFLIFYSLLITDKYKSFLLVFMFGIYAFVEYASMFFMRQIAQHADYNSFQGTRLASFNVIALNGVCPSLIYISVFTCAHLTSLSLDLTLMYTICGLIIISLVYNILFRYRAVK